MSLPAAPPCAVSRRGFLATALAAATAAMPPARDLCAAPETAATPPDPAKFLWGALLHMGTNMWSDIPVDSWGPFKGEQLQLVCQSDRLRFDEAVWQTITGRMREAGMNLVVIDLGEALQYESHPELAVQGSWPVERFRKELARLRGLGLEPIPKLNFSTTHDTWLKDYGRQVSTATYYRVCADLVREVCAIFDQPRFFHLGYDEETAGHQAKYGHVVVRQGELWWHDFLFLVRQVERQGVRPWIWADYCWAHSTEFLQRMPKSVLQSNWYYGDSFDPAKQPQVKAYLDLDRAGFDQIPTGSNWSCDTNFQGTVDFCGKHLAAGRLKGFLMAPWFFTLPEWRDKNLQAIAQVEQAIRAR